MAIGVNWSDVWVEAVWASVWEQSPGVEVSCTVDALTVNTYQAAAGTGTVVVTSVDGLALSTLSANVIGAAGVDASTAGLTLSTASATVTVPTTNATAPWFTRWPRGNHPGTVIIPMAAGQSFRTGDFYSKNGSDEAVKVSVTNPAQVAGLVYTPYAVEDPSKLLGIAVSQTTTFAFCGKRAPVSGDVGNNVDFAFDGNVLVVDPDSTTAPRATIVDVDEPRALYFVKIMSAYQQT